MFVVILGVDFPYNGLHRHSRAGVLAGKEDTEHRTENKGNKADDQ